MEELKVTTTASKEEPKSRKGVQPTASPEEAAERASMLRTQGRKGCKAARMNMAFTPENYEFIRVVARVTGKTMTEYTNHVIAQYRTEHPDLYDRAMEIIKDI